MQVSGIDKTYIYKLNLTFILSRIKSTLPFRYYPVQFFIRRYSDNGVIMSRKKRAIEAQEKQKQRDQKQAHKDEHFRNTEANNLLRYGSRSMTPSQRRRYEAEIRAMRSSWPRRPNQRGFYAPFIFASKYFLTISLNPALQDSTCSISSSVIHLCAVCSSENWNSGRVSISHV
jgi:hypothetical protein